MCSQGEENVTLHSDGKFKDGAHKLSGEFLK